MSLVAQTILALSILEAVAAAHQLRPIQWRPVQRPVQWRPVQRPVQWARPLLVQPTTHVTFPGATATGYSRASGPTFFAVSTTSGVASGVRQRPTQCHYIPDPGQCRGAFPRYFYNEALDQCDCFLYGGCDNEVLIQSSTWLSVTECNDICHPGNTEEGPQCKLLPKEGIQMFAQPSIVDTPDTSHLTDEDLLDALGFRL